uniref:AAA+ ATPase domain-containing protein n=1 Tax=Schistocephalus solidus TaxID=70667 RepID=A0A0X3PLQ4_SCHSO
MGAGEMDLPWIEKYRPESLNDLLSHKEIVGTIGRFLNQKKLPHLLFYGPPGTGKTSAILAVAKQLFTPREFSSMVLELNASDDRGIGVVREQVLTFASTKTLFSGKFKLVILDEADAMTKDAQNALRRIIEKFTENTRFCLICNYLSKITPAIQSRCTRFRFAPVDQNQLAGRLGEIALKEGVKLTEDGKTAIFRFSMGDMRKAINLLQSCSMSTSVVDEASVYACTGYPTPSEMKSVLEWCLNDSIKEAFKKVSEMKTFKGIALRDIISELHLLLMRVKIPDNVRADILITLAEVEHRMSLGASEKLQLGAVVAAFASARHALEGLS